MTCTPVAASGPLLTAVTVKVTFWPTLGVALSTVLLMATSAAAFGVTVTDAELFAFTRSGRSLAVKVTVFVRAAFVVTVAVTWSVGAAPAATDPTFQRPVAGL